MLDTDAAPEAQGVPPSDLMLLPDFIGTETQHDLVTWAKTMRPHLNANGAGRTFSKLQRLPSVSPYLRHTRMRLQQHLDLPPDAQPEAMFGWYLSIISAGGAVHPHLDAAPEGMRHLRCNLFLQLPDDGGFPIIEGKSIKVKERMILGFFPNERLHSSEAVSGERWRMICSFGYIVPLKYRLPDSSKLVPQENRSAVMTQAGGGGRLQGHRQGEGQARGPRRAIQLRDRLPPSGIEGAPPASGRPTEV